MKEIQTGTDRVLLGLFAVSLGMYAVLFSTLLSDLPVSGPEWHVNAVLLAHAIPMFCFQGLLCRQSTFRWQVLAPILMLLPVGLWFLIVCQWDGRAWLIYGLWCAPALLASTLSWLIFRGQRWLRDQCSVP